MGTRVAAHRPFPNRVQDHGIAFGDVERAALPFALQTFRQGARNVSERHRGNDSAVGTSDARLTLPKALADNRGFPKR